MTYESKNMNYIFNVEYFRDIFDIKDETTAEKILKGKNQGILDFHYPQDEQPLSVCKEMDGYQEFSLYTLYPGLLVGLGNPHSLAKKGAFKCGFTFDYVTGLPYITGSTLKGMLRSYFPGDTKDKEKNEEYTALIKGLLEREDLDVLALKDDIFEKNDTFLGAFPVVKQNDKIMEMEYVTSHQEKFKNPNPVSLIKVKPAVKFLFSFLFSDYKAEDGAVIVSAREKCKLCEELILLMGIGAKTNVGYGRFAKEKPVQQKLLPRSKEGNDKTNNSKRQENQSSKQAPECANTNCKNKVNYNKTQKRL